MEVRRFKPVRGWGWSLAVFTLGCAVGGTSPTASGGEPSSCSQLHRAVSRWQETEGATCGPDVTGLIELIPIGNDWLLSRRRFSSRDDLWPLTAEGAAFGPPASVDQVDGAATAGFTLLPGPSPRLLVYDPRQSQWSLYVTLGSLSGPAILASAGQGQWPAGYWPRNANGGPWNHQFVGLEEGNILDRDLGDGSTRIWSAVASKSGTSPVELVASATLAAGPDERFRRGHRLVHLGPGRLLAWMPRPCWERVAPSDPCAGSDFEVSSYSLDPGAAFSLESVSSGFWPDIGAESELVADGKHLFVWTRDTGRLRSFALDPTLADPLHQAPAADPPPKVDLASAKWEPPTTAPGIKRLVVILRDGQSFDSYFGLYCQSPPVVGAPPSCTSGPACCEAIPPAIAGATACVDPASEPGYTPDHSPACMRAKIHGGSMDGFAVPQAVDGCGDPRDFACAGTDPGSGAAAVHQRLAREGALADRFFQTYAFEDGVAGAAQPDALLPNLLYLVSARFASFPPDLRDRPLLTKELARLQVPWAIYARPDALALLRGFGVPIFYDPDWFPFRSLSAGEWEHDIASGELPAVAVVMPEPEAPSPNETGSQPFEPGSGSLEALLAAVAASPYRDDTLVLVAHLTAGGFYDHVRPPGSPPLEVDASSDSTASATAINYGPRVPLLAVGKLARADTVSHVQLEMSSITRFIEWNWLHGTSLKGIREQSDRRRYRDATVNNLGSLIDGAAAGIEVPSLAD